MKKRKVVLTGLSVEKLKTGCFWFDMSFCFFKIETNDFNISLSLS